MIDVKADVFTYIIGKVEMNGSVSQIFNSRFHISLWFIEKIQNGISVIL